MSRQAALLEGWRSADLGVFRLAGVADDAADVKRERRQSRPRPQVVQVQLTLSNTYTSSCAYSAAAPPADARYYRSS